MANYLDENGVLYLWSKIKAYVTSAISGKVDKVSGKGLSTNDYTTAEKNKLAGIAAGAEVNVQADWNATDTASDAFIKNKPASLPANGGDADTVNGHTVESNVPANAKFTDTTYSNFKGATASAAGTHGLVPAPAAGDSKNILTGDGNWSSLNLSFDSDSGLLQLLVGGGIYGTTFQDANADHGGLMSPTMFSKLDTLPTNSTLQSTYAKKSDITNVYKYKGSVADESKLPATGQVVGDVYDIQAASSYGGAGMNVGWNGTAWDPLGEKFQIASITNAQLDSICV